MENADHFGASTAPRSWHNFLERMRQPSAADFVKAIKSFIVSFTNNSPDPEKDSDTVQKFLNNMEVAFKAHPLWSSCSEEELENAAEGLEKYVMTKLFTRVFASVPEEAQLDEHLHEKMALLQQFVRPETLDIKPAFLNESSWLLAQKELQKINMVKAPRDKLVCILSCCKVITNLLHNASLTSSENPPGADEFLPVLIYVTLKANPPQLHSNLLYIQRYRKQSRLVSESAYYFTNMLSAESFISNIDANALSMDEHEYEKNMEFARTLLSGLSASSDDLKETTAPKQIDLETRKLQGSELSSDSNKDEEASRKDHPPLINKIPSVSDLENKGASIILNEEVDMNKTFGNFPYFFSQAGDLTVTDVEGLLENYRQLVFRYACLSKGLGISNPILPISGLETQSHDETGESVKREMGIVGGSESSMNGSDRDGNNSTSEDLNNLLRSVEENLETPFVEEAITAESKGNDNSS
ncbi:vacuolar protein sorting-associated protein 9A-like [Impatiens glandulifera]|uniref:vacuolar protein sorting-associated protein 9A-like n=1 Tax=Impatiens glandulifera TaxID=253017 RepID=UPI001FB0F369|nr:vacuolar protein sorting-associated protein 9A-like [Impatiens glandulifera]